MAHVRCTMFEYAYTYSYDINTINTHTNCDDDDNDGDAYGGKRIDQSGHESQLKSNSLF